MAIAIIRLENVHKRNVLSKGLVLYTLNSIIKYVLQGITDTTQIIDHIKEDNIDISFMPPCGCRTLTYGCQSCALMLMANGIIVEVIQEIVDAFKIDDATRADVMSMLQGSSDLEVNIIGFHDISIKIKGNGNVHSNYKK